MATTPSPVPAPAEPAQMNAFARMFGVLFSPGDTFRDIARAPGWIVPVIVYMVLGLLVIGVFSKRVGWDSFMRKQMERNASFAQLPPDQQRQRIEMATKVAPYTSSGGVIVVNLASVLLVGAILMGAFRVAMGSNLNYKQSLGIVSYAYMPLAVGGVLGIVILFLKDPQTVDLQNLVSANVGAFLAEETPRWQQALGQAIDLFSFWVIFLLATGFSVADPKKIKMGSALGVVIGAWVLWVLLKVGMAAAFS